MSGKPSEHLKAVRAGLIREFNRQTPYDRFHQTTAARRSKLSIQLTLLDELIPWMEQWQEEAAR